MRILVILAHPSPKSFNAAIAHTAVEALKASGHEVVFHDLYAEKFDPYCLPRSVRKKAKLPPAIKRHCEDLVSQRV
jgi:putative NADPH-quinone reductase